MSGGPAKCWIGHDGNPIVATEVDFEMVWDDHTKFPFFEDEDGGGVYGFGHQDKDAFARAANEYDIACGHDVPPLDQYTERDVIHAWAVVTEPRGDLQIAWNGVESTSLGAFPLTRIDQ